MKKVFYLTLFIVFMLFNINTVMAEACDSEDMARLKGLAAGVSYSSEFIGKNIEAATLQDYEVTFTGITDEIYVSDSHYTFTITNGQSKVFESGTHWLEVYSRNCNDLRLKSIKLDLPKFNRFSMYSDCELKKYKDLYVCDPWYAGELTDELFDKAISDRNLEVDNNINKIEFVKNFISSHLLLTSIIVVVIIIVIVMFFIKRVRDNMLD